MTDDNHCQSLVAQKEKAMREQKLPAAHFLAGKFVRCAMLLVSVFWTYTTCD